MLRYGLIGAGRIGRVHLNAITNFIDNAEIGFQRRFDHNFKALHQAVISGRIGELHYMNLTSRGPSAPPIEYVKVSGGIFMDMMIHDFDMARFLSQSEVTEVYAKGGYFLGNLLKDAGDYDSAIVEMTFKTGAWGTIHNARDAAYGYDQRAEIFGSKGMMLINNDSESNAVFSGKDGVTSEKPLFFFLERYTPAYAEEIRAFTNAVINKTPSPVNAFDGLQPVIIALACLKSAKENRVVKISEIS
ncbi:hypothetical protein CHS0354_002080 [Potamilus streckersoni]|uniref:GFO/IDH/MocA-like oxidoreductase domain-containing protein n=1 Tax=Potamilus streckersoni TaxID=2493646 RepID=A0AAE0T5M1_9BIVA|nr:hypothetical protein CHS0354_002080 [Potamilus streckersoni]